MRYRVFQVNIDKSGKTSTDYIDSDDVGYVKGRLQCWKDRLCEWGYTVHVDEGQIIGVRDGCMVKVYSDPAVHLTTVENPKSKVQLLLQELDHEAAQQALDRVATRLAVNNRGGIAMQVSDGRDPLEETYKNLIAPEHSGKRYPIHDGTYTVVYPDESWRTFKVSTQPLDADFAPGSVILAFLSGPNSDSFSGDWVRFAYYDPDKGTYHIWKRFRSGSEAMEKIEVGVRVLLRDPAASAEAYALKSGRCARCGRKLTVPASLNRGLGPECAQKVGYDAKGSYHERSSFRVTSEG